MKREALIISAFVLIVLSSNGVQESGSKLFWSYCKPGNIALHYIYFSPFPLKIGQRFHYTANLSTSETIVDGTFHVKLLYQLQLAAHESINLTLIDEKINLCDQWVADSGYHCPIKPRDYIMTGTEVVPTLFKPGKYYGKVEVFDENGQVLICGRLNLTLA